MKYIRLQKTAPAKNPRMPPGVPETYLYGSVSPTHSLPVGYWIEGWLLSPHRICGCVQMLRVVRNDVDRPGIFTSTEVSAIHGDQEFCTVNSVYGWEENAADKKEQPG